MEDKKANSIWKISTIILLVAFVVLASFVLWEKAEAVRAKYFVNQAVEYINSNLIKSSTKAVLSNMESYGIPVGKIYRFTIKANDKEIVSYISSNGKYLISSDGIIDISRPVETTLITNKNQSDVEGGFKKLNDIEVCSENGKPLVYFFGLNTSDASNWEYPIFKEVISKFGDSISFHDNYLSENGLSSDQDVFSKYSTGDIPVLIIGCKYYRIGDGQSEGAEKEKQILIDLICEITNNQTESVCRK
jgi:uncharacterized protein YxeA